MTTETNYTVHVSNGKNGWHASTQFDLNERKVFKLETYKRSFGAGGIQTVATVWTKTDTGIMSHVMGFYGATGGDFNKTVLLSHPKRVTEKVVSEQHKTVVEQIDELRREAEQFYTRKAEAADPVAA